MFRLASNSIVRCQICIQDKWSRTMLLHRHRHVVLSSRGRLNFLPEQHHLQSHVQLSFNRVLWEEIPTTGYMVGPYNQRMTDDIFYPSRPHSVKVASTNLATISLAHGSTVFGRSIPRNEWSWYQHHGLRTSLVWIQTISRQLAHPWRRIRIPWTFLAQTWAVTAIHVNRSRDEPRHSWFPTFCCSLVRENLFVFGVW